MFEASKQRCTLTKASSHPLRDAVRITSKSTVQSKKAAKSSLLSNPLLNSLDGGDPLSMITASNDPLSILAVGTEESPGANKVFIAFSI